MKIRDVQCLRRLSLSGRIPTYFRLFKKGRSLVEKCNQPFSFHMWTILSHILLNKNKCFPTFGRFLTFLLNSSLIILFIRLLTKNIRNKTKYFFPFFSILFIFDKNKSLDRKCLTWDWSETGLRENDEYWKLNNTFH